MSIADSAEKLRPAHHSMVSAAHQTSLTSVTAEQAAGEVPVDDTMALADRKVMP
ncbi:hypothetical protein [Amycolatopsis sp. NBC_01480]|uniref:hypothetical protein n=1 Tax=Amycolatopsis sp. NBC_01480 TaxID=2903562 RepID=UPI002E2B11EC|nr:hypothetical protein [Amycolatopsis sp. NBC_01480]